MSFQGIQDLLKGNTRKTAYMQMWIQWIFKGAFALATLFSLLQLLMIKA